MWENKSRNQQHYHKLNQTNHGISDDFAGRNRRIGNWTCTNADDGSQIFFFDDVDAKRDDNKENSEKNPSGNVVLNRVGMNSIFAFLGNDFLELNRIFGHRISFGFDAHLFFKNRINLSGLHFGHQFFYIIFDGISKSFAYGRIKI